MKSWIFIFSLMFSHSLARAGTVVKLSCATGSCSASCHATATLSEMNCDCQGEGVCRSSTSVTRTLVKGPQDELSVEVPAPGTTIKSLCMSPAERLKALKDFSALKPGILRAGELRSPVTARLVKKEVLGGKESSITIQVEKDLLSSIINPTANPVIEKALALSVAAGPPHMFCNCESSGQCIEEAGPGYVSCGGGCGACSVSVSWPVTAGSDVPGKEDECSSASFMTR